jgi:hypothetical protein
MNNQSAPKQEEGSNAGFPVELKILLAIISLGVGVLVAKVFGIF